MKHIALLLLLLLPSHAAAAVTTAWANLPGGVAIATDAANNVYTATSDINPGSEIVLTKRTAAGAVLGPDPIRWRVTVSRSVIVLCSSFYTRTMGVGAVGISRSARDFQRPVGAVFASAGRAASTPYAAGRRSNAAGLICPSVECRRRWL